MGLRGLEEALAKREIEDLVGYSRIVAQPGMHDHAWIGADIG